jgi:hypothetical protein
MKSIPLFLLVSTLSATCQADDSISIFGLPLGGKMPAPVKVCAANQIGSEASMCWVGRPSSFKGSKSGYINLPGGSDRRPRWAAHAMFEATIARDGALEKISARTRKLDDRNEIMKSLEVRFGLPTEASPVSDSTSSANWHRKGVHIRMLCSRDIACEVAFSSQSAFDSLQKELAARRTKDAARPASP